MTSFSPSGCIGCQHDWANYAEHFVPTLRKYAEDIGLWEIMENMLYEVRLNLRQSNSTRPSQ